MRRERKPVPAHLRHRIVPAKAGFVLATHYGYVLKAFASIDEAQSYYAQHCPEA